MKKNNNFKEKDEEIYMEDELLKEIDFLLTDDDFMISRLDAKSIKADLIELEQKLSMCTSIEESANIKKQIIEVQEQLLLTSPKKTREKLKEYFGNICWYCGISLEKNELVDIKKGHIEHVIARKNDGEHKLLNLALACPMCNCAKRSMPLIKFLTWLIHIRSDNFKCLILTVQDLKNLIGKELLKTESQQIIQCSNCNYQLKNNANFCPECGYQVVSELKLCPTCKILVSIDWHFCIHCGTNLRQIHVIERH